MGATYQLLLGGQQADQTLYTLITSVEVDESMDMPAAVQISLPISRSNGGDLSYIDDPRFAPMATVSIVAMAGGSGASGVATGAVGAVAAAVGGGSAPPGSQCIFDGYMLSQKIHLETGVTNATLTAWGQDACWLMNQTETVKEWVDVTDSDVAASIFGDYGITPAPDNSQNDSPSHTEDTHSLMQRGSDIAFLRTLARRTGKCCRVACADQPGQRTGYFAIPNLNGDPAVSVKLNDSSNWTIGTIDLEWDATRPTSVVARSALFSDSDPNGAVGDSTSSGLNSLDARDLATFAGSPMTVILATAVDSAGELTQRAQGLLSESGWFVRCQAEAEADRLGVVLRPGMLVALDGIGALHSGSWIVWNVRHKLTQEGHKMHFTLLRNAVGNAPTGTSGGLSALVGAA
jgi:phage protein D